MQYLKATTCKMSYPKEVRVITLCSLQMAFVFSPLPSSKFFMSTSYYLTYLQILSYLVTKTIDLYILDDTNMSGYLSETLVVDTNN